MRSQMRIQAVAQAPRHKMFCNIAMRHLCQRMHAGVGAPSAMNANLLAADRLDRGFQRALYGGAVVLDLPAAKRRAVIFDGEFVAGHFDPIWASSSAKADDPVFRDVSVQSQCRGVLDTPPSRGMTMLCGVRCYVSRAGGFSGVPRKNSSAFIGCLPERCSSRIRIAPCLQATAR